MPFGKIRGSRSSPADEARTESIAAVREAMSNDGDVEVCKLMVTLCERMHRPAGVFCARLMDSGFRV